MAMPFVGEIRLFPWNWPPRLWALCNGALLPIAQNQALFALLGTTYGGNGVQNFALPDLRGRVAIHRSPTYTQGETDGTETVTLTLATMPMHNHNFLGTSSAGNQTTPQGVVGTDSGAGAAYLAPDTTPFSLAPTAITMAGSSFPHNNMQPYLVMNYSIATQGIFPSRN
jgi:microcystin-dependent protein